MAPVWLLPGCAGQCGCPRAPGAAEPHFLGARGSGYSQTPQRARGLVARGGPGALVVLRVLPVQGVLPGRAPQACRWGRGLPCFPAQVGEKVITSALRVSLNPRRHCTAGAPVFSREHFTSEEPGGEQPARSYANPTAPLPSGLT